jgi:Flp pilus assembly protein TadG
VRSFGDTRARRRQGRESGQAMVEFALILFPLLLLVVGVIQFGIGLNYWLDMQRIANQGARWAAVNNWPPDCQRSATTCTNTPPCTSLTRASTTLQNTLECQILTAGLQRAATVEVCYPNAGNKDTGNPVKVRLEADFTFVPLLGIGTITLGADATMRLEQSQLAASGGKITGDVGATC